MPVDNTRKEPEHKFIAISWIFSKTSMERDYRPNDASPKISLANCDCIAVLEIRNTDMPNTDLLVIIEKAKTDRSTALKLI